MYTQSVIKVTIMWEGQRWDDHSKEQFQFSGYNYADYILPQEEIETYKPPPVLQNADLSKRVAALEDWAVKVDSRLRQFNTKLSKFDNFEAQIERYSIKHMQQNLIQILTTDDTDVLAVKLKSYFDKHYINSEQLQAMSQEIHERLLNSWKPDLDEEKIRRSVQEYLAVFERRQMEIIAEKLKEYVRDIEVHRGDSTVDVEAVKRVVAGMLNIYDADKTGLVDYALESAGKN